MPQSVATPNMNLATWPTTGHFFNHTELSANFSKIDQHDHTSGKGLPIPAGGLAAGAVTNSSIAGNAVTTAKIADANVTDAKLSSPNNGVYRRLLNSSSWLQWTGGGAGSYVFPSNQMMVQSGSGSIGTICFIYFDASDYAVAGKTTFLRLRATVATNATAPAQTFTFGFYPVTFGGAGSITATLGTVITGSTAAIATPSSSSATTVSSGDFAAPSTGVYAPGLVLSGTMTTNSAITTVVSIDIHNV